MPVVVVRRSKVLQTALDISNFSDLTVGCYRRYLQAFFTGVRLALVKNIFDLRQHVTVFIRDFKVI